MTLPKNRFIAFTQRSTSWLYYCLRLPCASTESTKQDTCMRHFKALHAFERISDTRRCLPNAFRALQQTPVPKQGELVKNVSHQLLGIESGIDTSSFSAVTENPESETHRKMQLARSLGMKLVIFWHCLIMVVKHWMPTATVPMHLKSTDIGHSTASLMHKCLSPFIFWLLDYNKWCHYNFYWWHWMQPNWPLICHTKHHACCLIRPHCQRDLEAKW